MTSSIEQPSATHCLCRLPSWLTQSDQEYSQAVQGLPSAASLMAMLLSRKPPGLGPVRKAWASYCSL